MKGRGSNWNNGILENIVTSYGLQVASCGLLYQIPAKSIAESA